MGHARLRQVVLAEVDRQLAEVRRCQQPCGKQDCEALRRLRARLAALFRPLSRY